MRRAQAILAVVTTIMTNGFRPQRFAFAVLILGAVTGCVSTSERYERLLKSAAAPLDSRQPPRSTQAPPPPPNITKASGPATSPFDEATELHLDILRREVLRRNPTLTAMQNAFRASVARYPQVTALDDPVFSYGLAPASVSSNDVDFGQRIELAQHFPWPGKLRLRGEVALNDAQAAEEDVEATRLQLIEATDQVFYDYYYVYRAIDINGINVELLLEFKSIADTRYAAGLGAKQDALQAEVEHQHLIHRRIVLEKIRAVTAERLNTLLNRPPETRLPPPPEGIDEVARMPLLPTLHAAALTHRPELRALAERVRARTADVQLAQREYFPDFTIFGIYNSLWQEEDLHGLTGVAFNVPLQLDRRQAALDEARARTQEMEARLEEEHARVLFQVSSAVQDAEEAARVTHLYATSIIPATEESVAAARSGYEVGTNDFLTLIVAEKALMLAQLSYQEALTEYHQGRARVERAVGLPLDEVEELR